MNKKTNEWVVLRNGVLMNSGTREECMELLEVHALVVAKPQWRIITATRYRSEEARSQAA